MDFNDIFGYEMNGAGREGGGNGRFTSDASFSERLPHGGGLAERLKNPGLAKKALGELHWELIAQFGHNLSRDICDTGIREDIFLRDLHVVVDDSYYIELVRKVLNVKGYDFASQSKREQFEADWERAYEIDERFRVAFDAKYVKMSEEERDKVELPSIRSQIIYEPMLDEKGGIILDRHGKEAKKEMYGCIATFKGFLYDELK